MSDNLQQQFKNKNTKKDGVHHFNDKLNNTKIPSTLQPKKFNNFSDINRVTVRHRISTPIIQTKYAILLDNKIIQNIESINKFHEVIINAINAEIQQLNVIYDLDINELKKNDMYNVGKYLVVNDKKIYLITKVKKTSNTWGYSNISSSLNIDKEWTLIEKL